MKCSSIKGGVYAIPTTPEAEKECEKQRFWVAIENVF